MEQSTTKIAVIGLGYVGLPLAVAFAQKYSVIGYDHDPQRVDGLITGHDSTLEVADEELAAVKDQLLISADPEVLNKANCFIITVPTPITKNKKPDLQPLIEASTTVGRHLRQGDYVIYESTVYPGATEEDCVPVLEQISGLKINQDFHVGYSPERVNPGDKKHPIKSITKICSGSTPDAAEEIAQLYESIIEGGVFRASSIKVAEAAKVFENAQRDLNIAYVNELAKICHILGIDTNEVVDAMNTKWNALKFRPGLVGGHCISIDPFYLTHKAQELGYHPEIILAGRRLNDTMGQYLGSRVIKLMIRKGHRIANSKVLVLGITFKENCPDIRNSRVVDVVEEMKSFGCQVDIHDPWADPAEVEKQTGLHIIPQSDLHDDYQAVVIAVAHNEFKTIDYRTLAPSDSAVIFDIKGILPVSESDERL